MKNNNRFHVKNKQSIKAIESTDERITGRAGLALFSRYLRSNQLMTIVELKFGSMRKNKKGIPVTDLFIQLLCFFWTAPAVIFPGLIISNDLDVPNQNILVL